MNTKPFKPSEKHLKILNIFMGTDEQALRTDEIRSIYRDTTESVRGLLMTLVKHGYVKSKLHSGLMNGYVTKSRYRIGKYRAWSITPIGEKAANEDFLRKKQVKGNKGK